MPKVSPLQSNFGSGEFSPLLYGRVDSDRYKTALGTCLNYLPTIQGGLIRRSGSAFVAEIKDSSKVTRLVSFEFSTTQAYIIEFGNTYIRFFKDNGQILSAGIPYEIVSPYLTADLFQLKFTQSADVLYIVHPSYAPRKLTRTSHTSWTLTVIDFLDGPYMPQNATTTTITPSAATGAGITLTASAALFVSTDVGRLVRIKIGALWGYCKITAFTSSTVVTADVKSLLGGTTASTAWRLGVWSDTTGYPSCVTFHEDRLMFGGATLFPQRFDGSNTSDYENMAPTGTDGIVVSSNAISFSLAASDVNVIRWLASDEKGLGAGSVGREWVIRPSSQSEALSPTNVAAKPATAYGSSNIQPVQVGKATLFIQRAGKKVREFTYFYDVDGFRATDISTLSEHITGTGLTQLAYQKEPQSIVWCVRQDGVLAAMTYERDLDSLKVGWSRHIVGGVSDAADSAAKVESVAVIPSPDGTRDEVWVIVQRYINGSVKRYVEYFTKLFDSTTEQRDAFFVDCGLTYDNPVSISGITRANPGVVTANAHGFSNGNKVLITEVLGMNTVNSQTFLVAGATANTFQLTTIAGANVDTSAYNAYVSGGKVRKLVSSISGLSHLEGQSVDILADGAVQPAKTVTAGAVTLSDSAAVVHIGLGYNSDGQLLRIEAGSADGTALGKKRRMHYVGMLLYRTLGMKVGMDFDELDEITFRRSSDKLTRAPGLFSGILAEEVESDYDFENQFCWRQDQPLPGMILAVMPQMVTQDKG